jgi:hypothetical protein
MNRTEPPQTEFRYPWLCGEKSRQRAVAQHGRGEVRERERASLKYPRYICAVLHGEVEHKCRERVQPLEDAMQEVQEVDGKGIVGKVEANGTDVSGVSVIGRKGFYELHGSD